MNQTTTQQCNEEKCIEMVDTSKYQHLIDLMDRNISTRGQFVVYCENHNNLGVRLN